MAAQDKELSKIYVKLNANSISEGKTLRNTLTRPGSPQKKKGGIISESKIMRGSLTRLGSSEVRKEAHHRPGAEVRKEAHHRPGAKMPREPAYDREATYGGRVKS